jgi:acetyl-CoA carboxylase carboxyltransferase component
MSLMTSNLDTRSEAYQANRDSMLALLHRLDEEQMRANAGGGGKYVERHRSRGRMLPRERINLLVDRDTAFLELSPLAAWGTDFVVGASVVTGVGVVSGVESVIIANDGTVRGGTSNPYTWKKMLRALQIARENRLPVINLVESGGADLPSQADLFVPAGRLFHDLTRLSAAGIPTVALVFGNSTAGGAYVPGMCDYAVMVANQAKVFLGGPPLVKMATGEVSTDEELGGADMHSRVSGLSDYSPPTSSTASASAGTSWPAWAGASWGRRRSTPPGPPPTTPTRFSASSPPTCASPSTPRRSWPASSTDRSSPSTSRCTAPAW